MENKQGSLVYYEVFCLNLQRFKARLSDVWRRVFEVKQEFAYLVRFRNHIKRRHTNQDLKYGVGVSRKSYVQQWKIDDHL